MVRLKRLDGLHQCAVMLRGDIIFIYQGIGHVCFFLTCLSVPRCLTVFLRLLFAGSADCLWRQCLPCMLRSMPSPLQDPLR